MTVKPTKCDATIADDARAICDKPAVWRSVRQLLDGTGSGYFQLFFCAQHEDRARRAVPGVRLVQVDRIAVDDGHGVH